MKAQKQGDHDGACGFYAVGNALKLLFPKCDIDEIFKEIFRVYFEKHEGGKHLIDGTNRVQISSVLKGTIHGLDLPVTVATPFWSSSAIGLSEFRSTVVDHLKDESTSAIVSYYYYKDSSNEDDDGHWTVLRAATEKSVYTFDSSYEKSRIRFAEIRIAKEATPHASRPYLFRSTELFLLKRER